MPAVLKRIWQIPGWQVHNEGLGGDTLPKILNTAIVDAGAVQRE